MRQCARQGRRWLQARSTAHQQRDAEVILQRLDALTGRRGCNGQSLGGALERTGAQGQFQCLQGAQMSRSIHLQILKIFFSMIKNL